MTKKQQGFGTVSIVLIMALPLIIGATIWYVLGQSPKTTVQQPVTQPSQASTPSSENYLILAEWGVRFRLTDDLKSLSSFRPTGATIDGFSFTTSQLSAQEPKCSGNDEYVTMPLGLLSRSKTQQPGMGKIVAHIDDYYYQYRSSDTSCSEANTDLEVKTAKALGEAVLTLEAVEN